jgi:phosphoenolpyruvate carboxykinase (GTP)
LFTNVALTPDNDVWWEGMTKTPPPTLVDWKGKAWTPASTEKAAHPNSRFTAPIGQCPVASPAREDPNGVPISAIIFGGRRSSVVPLVYESFNWLHGTFMGATLTSEQTSAAEGKVGDLRKDPFAMLPFAGYNMADYFGHWLSMPKRSSNSNNLPKIFHVNWFKKSKEGKFLWPGYGENSRVLKWIFDRCDGNQQIAQKTPIGYVPTPTGLDVSGLKITTQDMQELLKIDRREWEGEVEHSREYFKIFGHRLPDGSHDQLNELESRLKKY